MIWLSMGTIPHTYLHTYHIIVTRVSLLLVVVTTVGANAHNNYLNEQLITWITVVNFTETF